MRNQQKIKYTESPRAVIIQLMGDLPIDSLMDDCRLYSPDYLIFRGDLSLCNVLPTITMASSMKDSMDVVIDTSTSWRRALQPQSKLDIYVKLLVFKYSTIFHDRDGDRWISIEKTKLKGAIVEVPECKKLEEL